MSAPATDNAPDVLALCAGLPLEHFPAGAVLVAEGPASDRLYILVSGEVAVLRGATHVAEVDQPGAIFGEIAALLGGPHTATVRAVTEVSAYRIDAAAARLMEGSAITWHVARILARRLIDATTYLADFKAQFADRADHFAMVDQVLDTLVQRQRPAVSAGPSGKPDSRL